MNYVPEHGLFEVEAPAIARLVSDLLATRAATAAAGNRRPLFAAMDLLLAGPETDDPGNLPTTGGPGAVGRSVRLERLRLTNWKAFERADIVLPYAGPDRPVVVVGGANGFGKSSILEAFALGLFGRRAISDVGFLTQAGGGRGEQRRAYRSTLERNLHRSERARDEGMCSVSLDFTTADGPVCVERKWYFEEDGTLIEDEEELLVRLGEDRHLLDTPAGVAAAEWYEEEIDRRIMPSGLAPFFVFDGEQVERWAERRLTDQVRVAISRMLGIESLRGLVDDLNAYARDRERDGLPEESESDGAQTQVETLEAELRATTAQLDETGSRLADLRQERERALQHVATLGGGSHADLQDALENEHRLAAEREVRLRELVSVIAEHGPALLAGGLLIRTAEAIEGIPRHGGAQLTQDEIEAVWERFASMSPTLPDQDRASLRDRFLRSFDAAAEDATDDAHSHLDRQFRRLVTSRLRSAAAEGKAKVGNAAAAARDATARLASARDAAVDRERRSSQLTAAKADLARLSAAIEAAEAERGSLSRHAEDLRSRTEPLRELAQRREYQLRVAAPRLRAAARARSLATTVEAHLAEIAHGEHRRLGEEVTRSFRALSHKDQLDRIDIGADGKVTLLDASGRDVTDYRLSAGESQLFALALISAVGAIVGDRLPLIVDTPLSRLDTRHRESVLDMLAQRRSQTILLTHPEEVSARYLTRLSPVLGAALHLTHTVDPVSSVGTSRVAKGYDPDDTDRAAKLLETGDISA